MKLEKLLANLGYGSRKDIARALRNGYVALADGTPVTSSDIDAPYEDIRFDGEPLDPPIGLTILMNKPAGYSCTTEDPGRTVYALLPERFAHRNPVPSTVGRLDKDTTGLLLMTDDGKLLHRIISPKANIWKTYDAVLARPLTGGEAETFASGALMLKSEKTPLRPARLEVLDPTHVRLSISEGRYHQVRRMFAAVGNHVESLSRTALGTLTLGDLPEGEYRKVTDQDLAAVFAEVAF